MGNERYTSRVAVIAIIRKGDEILLQKRMNTGYKDGFYDFGASGHLEQGESLKMAMKREVEEELGIYVEMGNIAFSSMVHRNDLRTNSEYIYAYFVIEKFTGEPSIMEPDKNSNLQWASVRDLPENLIEDRKIALENITNKVSYSEIGW